MKIRFSLSLLCLVAVYASAAPSALPPEKLLPKETLVVIAAPDTQKFLHVATNSVVGLLWRAPEMKAFHDKFMTQLKSSAGASLETGLGLKLDDLGDLAQGETVFALLGNDDPDHPENKFEPLLLIDARDHADQLRQTLATVKKKWADAGKPMKTAKIHEFEFTTFTSESTGEAATPKPDGSSDSDNSADANGPPAAKKSDFIIGQVDSLLIISSSSSAIDKVLSRRGGGLIPALDEQPSFQADFAARLREAPCYAWVNAKALTDLYLKGNNDDPVAPGSVSLPTVLTVSGLRDITSACFTIQSDSTGTTSQLYVTVPEANRRGLIKALAVEAKDSSPPAFVPADTVKYWRWRVDLRKTWNTLEQMLNDINPNYGGVINFVLSSAGKDKDEKYDLKAELLGNLGDDVIKYVKAPKGNTLEAFNSAPDLLLIGSPNPDKLAAAVKVGLGVLTAGNGGVKEQEFLGRTIYSVTMPGAKGDSSPIYFAGSGAYVAFSIQNDMVEEYLRSNEGKSKPLSDTDGLADAAQKVGGSSTGFFEYDNFAQSAKCLFDLVHGQNVSFSDILGANNQAGQATPSIAPADQLAKFKDWADFSLLPPFDSVSKYFYLGAQSVRFSPDGFSWTMFAPTPPKLR